MKKLFAIIATMLTLAAPTALQAFDGCQPDRCCEPDFCCQGRLYAGIFGGVNWLDYHREEHHANPGGIVGAEIGYAWTNWRSEFEFSYRYNKLEHRRRHEHSYSFMVNEYYDFCAIHCGCFQLRPFLGAGIGYDRVHTQQGEESKHSGFSWQLMGGVAYELCDNIELDAEYKFHRAHRRIYDHSLTVGLKKFF